MKKEIVNGFVKRVGKTIVNGDGTPFLLKGVGLGSWLLPEGYMLELPKKGDRPRHIEKMVLDLVGEKDAKTFWELYRTNYIGEEDIKAIKKAGFNSIRLPFNSRNLIENASEIGVNETELAYIDQVINWCETYKLYVILDMHGAPGGQTGANIDDSKQDLPELFTETRYKVQALKLWQFMANRYKDRWIIAGYDLLNEPLPDFHGQYNHLLIPMYQAMIEVIRQVDKEHMIIVEGLHWATDFSVFDKVLDDNSMLQFHKYWNENSVDSIQRFLDTREQLNLPLFMGEGGENNNVWYKEAFTLLEEHDISWNFWTWKKMNKTNSPYSNKRPSRWHLICDYLEGGKKPEKKISREILWEYVDNLHLRKCKYYPDVIEAIL